MVGGEGLQASLEVGQAVEPGLGDAGAEALAGGAGVAEGDGGDAVVEDLSGEVATAEAGVAEGEVESVGDGLVEVRVVDEVEAVAEEELLQE